VPLVANCHACRPMYVAFGPLSFAPGLARLSWTFAAVENF